MRALVQYKLTPLTEPPSDLDCLPRMKSGLPDLPFPGRTALSESCTAVGRRSDPAVLGLRGGCANRVDVSARDETLIS